MTDAAKAQRDPGRDYECGRCSGYGYEDDGEDERECRACGGDGVLQPCSACKAPQPDDEAGCLECGEVRS